MNNHNGASDASNKKLFFTGTEILSMPTDKSSYLWQPYIQRGQISILAGTSDVGKSTLLRQLALLVSCGGKTFLDQPLQTKTNRALFYSTEDNLYATKQVLEEQNKGLQLEKLDEILFLFEQDKPVQKINEILKDNPVDLVIIDSFTDTFEGDINNSISVRKFMKDFSQMAVNYDCAVILLHHIGKGKEEGPASKNNLLGSTGIEAKARLVMELKGGKHADERELWFTKGNSLTTEQKSKGMIISLGEHRTFSFKSDKAIKNVDDGNKKTKFDNKEAIVNRIVELKNNGLSFDKIKGIIDIDFSADNPSLGTIKNWFIEWEAANQTKNAA